MKVHFVLSAVGWLSLETLATGSDLVDGGDTYTIKNLRNEQQLRAVNGGGPKAMAVTPPAAAAASAAADQVLATCSGEDSFSLDGFDTGSYDGCYTAVILNQETAFVQLMDDGDFQDGLLFTGFDSSLGVTTWGISFGVYDSFDNEFNTQEVSCIDNDLVSTSGRHPTEVADWFCNATAVVTDVAGDFDVTCECSSSSASTAISSFLVGPGPLTTGGAFLALLGANLLLAGRSASVL